VRSGFFFAVLFGVGNALAEPDGLEEMFSGDTEASKTLLLLQFIFVPFGALGIMFLSLSGPLQTGVTFAGAGALFYLADSVITIFLILLDLDLRPAMLFYQQVKPLLRVMWAGLASFAIGYGFTILLFAGFYMALYRLNPDFFALPQGRQSLLVWDFIYFSVTTITTVGLSDVKPGNAMFVPQAVVSAELIVGVFWIVVYFAVAMTLLQAHAKTMLDSLTQEAKKQKTHPTGPPD
jgi:hypothetical protein